MKYNYIILLITLVLVFSTFISADCISDCADSLWECEDSCVYDEQHPQDYQYCMWQCEDDYDTCAVECESNLEDPEPPEEPENPNQNPEEKGSGIFGDDYFDKNVYITPFIFGVLKNNSGKSLIYDKDYNFSKKLFVDSLEFKQLDLKKSNEDKLFLLALSKNTGNLGPSYLGHYNNDFKFSLIFKSEDYRNKDLNLFFTLRK